MYRNFIIIALTLLAAIIFIPKYESKPITVATTDVPLPPEAGVATTTVATPATPTVVSTPAQTISTSAMRLSIPSISLNNAVVPVGVNAKGEMDVPSGSSGNVGWYKDGTVPGDTGSAVFDAHVFAAFAKLNRLKVGSDMYVDSGGARLHFVVRSSKLYALSAMDHTVAESIFNQTGGKYLNLITCAGSLTADHSTYDHRLLIRAELVD